MAISVLKEWVVNKWTKTLLNDSKYFIGARKENQESDITNRLTEFVDLLLRALFNDYFVRLEINLSVFLISEKASCIFQICITQRRMTSKCRS